MTIDAGELTNIINELSCNKSPGLGGLTAEHIKFADSQLVVLLSISNICSKIIDVVLFNTMDTYLQNTPHQFGFKSKHRTEFAFK